MKHVLSKISSRSFKIAVQNSTAVRQKFFRNFAICFQAPLVHCRAPLPPRILQNIGAFKGKSKSNGIKYYNLIGYRKGSNFWTSLLRPQVGARGPWQKSWPTERSRNGSVWLFLGFRAFRGWLRTFSTTSFDEKVSRKDPTDPGGETFFR